MLAGGRRDISHGPGGQAQYIEIPHLGLQSKLAGLNMFERLNSVNKIDAKLLLNSFD